MSFLCIAHRGAMGYEPENTLLSINKAIELGAEWAEIDVHYIDKRLIVSHDAIIKKEKTDLDLYSCNFNEIRKIKLYKDQQIPTLEEILQTVEGRMKLNIELKGKNTALPTMNLLATYLQSGKFTEQDFLISSFIFEELGVARKLMPTIPIGVLTETSISDAINYGELINACCVNISIQLANKESINMLHKKGFKVFVYTVNNAKDIMKLKGIGTDGVFSNYIDECLICVDKEK